MPWWVVIQPCPILCDPKDCSPPGSVHGVFQARILEWLPFSSPGDLLDLRMEPSSPVSLAMAGGFFTIEPPGKPIKHMHTLICIKLSCIWRYVQLGIRGRTRYQWVQAPHFTHEYHICYSQPRDRLKSDFKYKLSQKMESRNMTKKLKKKQTV